MRKRTGFIVLSSSVVASCLGPGKATDDSGTPSTESTTIQEIQQGGFADATEFQIVDAVVTSGFTLEGEGFFIQQQGGGEYSGIYVYTGGPFDSFEPAVGDLIDIYGALSEYYDFTELSVGTERAITVKGTADPVADAIPAEGVQDWEPWESNLITLADQSAGSALNNYGELTLSPSNLTMADMFLSLSATEGYAFGDVTGIVTYGWETFRINPRSDADIENGNEPAQIVGAADIQQGRVAEGSVVTMESVVVCTPSTSDGKGFFVQDQGGGEYSGIYIYVGSTSGLVIPVGTVVDVKGIYSEYYDLSEISASSQDVVPTGATASCVATPVSGSVSDWEPYEGVLVEMQDVSFTAAADSYNETETNYGITVDDLFFDYTAVDGTEFQSLTGIIQYYYNFKVCPRTSDDLVE